MKSIQSAHRWIFVTCVPTVILLAASFVHADFVIVGGEMNAEVSLSADLDGDGSVDIGNQGSDRVLLPSSQIAVYTHKSTEPLTSFFGEGAAYQDQFGINAVFVDSRSATVDGGNFFGDATSHYATSIRVTESLSAPVAFTFVINSGELRVRNIDDFDTNGSTAPSRIRVAADVHVPGMGNWIMVVVLERNGVGGPFSVTIDPVASKDSLNLGFPTLAVNLVDVSGDGVADDAVVSIPRIEKTVMIDQANFEIVNVNLGDPSQRIIYNMDVDIDLFGAFSASAVAGITDPFALGTPNDTTDDLGGNFSPLGVEFFLNGQPLSDFPIIVPTPGTLTLLSLGGLLLARRGETIGGR